MYFLPKGRSIDPGSYKLQIFDIWGELIFETTSTDDLGSPDEKWYGTVGGKKDGKPVPQGTYVWKISAKFQNSEWQGIDTNGDVKGDSVKTGTIYLFR